MHFLIHSSEQGYCSPSYPTRIPTHNLEFCPLGFILHIETTMRMGIMDMIMMMMTGGSLGGAVAVAEADKVTPPCRGRHTNTHYSGQDATLLQEDATLCTLYTTKVRHIKIV